MNQAYSRRIGRQGFTLIELLIVVVIVAILAAVALPAYNDSVTRSRRAEGKQFLLEMAQAQERHFTEYNRYAATSTAGTASATDLGRGAGGDTSDNGHYRVAFVLSNGNAAFDATATALGGQDTADTTCGNLGIDELGVKTAELGNQATCWAR